MNSHIYFLLFSLLLFQLGPLPCQAAKFLFTFFHDKGSHFGSMRPMMESLARKGHSVTLLDTIFDSQVSPLFRQIQAKLPSHDGDEEWKAKFAHILWHSRLTSSNLIFYYSYMDTLLGTLMLNHAEKVVELLNEPWDFIVIDDLFWSFGFALTTLKHRVWERNGSVGPQPHVIVYATAAQSLISAESVKSVGRNWVSRAPLFSFLPDTKDDAFSPNKFTHRLFAFYEVAVEFVIMNLVNPQRLMPNMEKFGVPNFSWPDFYSRQSLELSDSVDRIGWPLAVGTEMTNVGAHCKQPKQMPSQFAEFIERPGSKGLVYVAFGTHADWSLAPARVRDAIFGAFNRLPEFRFIFVYNGPTPAGLGPHILLTKWAPQLEILAHPGTRAFISHGGNKSIREALCAGVPIIVMPIYAEQAHTADLLLSRGIAPMINKFTMTEQSVFDTVHGVLTSAESRAKASKLKAMFLDRPMPALEEGMFAMERLMRKSRWREFTQRKGMHLDWAQFLIADWLPLIAGLCLLLAR